MSDQPTPRDPKGYLSKRTEYQYWARMRTAQIRHMQPSSLVPPDSYWFLEKYPDNFRQWRDEFDLHWAVKRLTR